MTYPAFPFPVKFERPQYQETEMRLGVQSPFDGEPKFWLQFSVASEPYALPMRVTLAEREQLRTFWRQDIKGGTVPFTAPHPITAAVTTWRWGDVARPPVYVLEPGGQAYTTVWQVRTWIYA